MSVDLDNKRLRSELQETTKQLEEAEKEIEELRQNEGITESMLKDQMEKTLLDLEVLADERDQLRDAMNEAINKCASSLLKQQNLEKDHQKTLKQIDNLIASKGLLQQTMSEQVNSLRMQISNLREEKRAIEEEMDEVYEENKGLKEMLGK